MTVEPLRQSTILQVVGHDLSPASGGFVDDIDRTLLYRYAFIFVLASGAGARLLTGYDPDGWRTEASGASLVLGTLAVVGSIALLARAGSLLRVTSAMASDPAYALLIISFLVGSVLFATREGGGLSAFEGMIRLVGGIIVGVAGARLLGLAGVLRSARLAAVLVSAVSLGLNAIQPKWAHVGYRNEVFAGIFAWNSAAGYTAGLGLVLTIYLLWQYAPGSRLRSRLAFSVSIVICVLVLLWSASRTSQFATLGALSIGMASFLRSRVAQAAALLIGAAFMLVFLVTGAGYVLDRAGKDSTLTGRSSLWDLSLAAIGDHPVFGYGIGNFWKSDLAQSAFAESIARQDSGHNAFIDLLLGGGFIALIAVVMLIHRALRRALSLNDESPGTRRAIFATLAFTLILSLALSVLFRNGFLPAIFVALTVPSGLLSREPSDRHGSRLPDARLD